MKFTVIASKGSFETLNAAAFAEEQIDWWDNSQVKEQSICTVAWAATELQKHLPGNVVLADANEPLCSSSETVIYLGNADWEYMQTASKKLNLPLCGTTLPAESFRAAGNILDGTTYVLLSGVDRVGTMYAAFAYLERWGLRFIEPGDPCVDSNAVCKDTDFDITGSPDYLTRGTMSTFIDASEDFLLWMAHNRFNSGFFRKANHHFAMRKKLGIDTVVGGHQMFYLFADTKQEYPYCHKLYGGIGKPEDPYPVSPLCTPPSGENGILTYGDAHPEWYALIDGERRMRRDRQMFLETGNAPGDNMCTSNEDAMTELCRLVIDALIDGVWKYADHIHIWPLDNGAWCQCEECQKQGNFSARILKLAHRIDLAAKKAYEEGRLKRKVLLITPAYHETLPVPDQPLPENFDYNSIMTVFYPIERCFAHDLDDPICTETNKLLMDRLLPWCNDKHYQGEVVIGEYYNVSTFAALPFVLTKRILHEIPMYYRLGSRHFHYMHITARDWGFIAINNYLHSRLLWNIHTDPEQLVASYFSARYGDLAEDMRKLYEFMEATTLNCKYYKHYQFVNGTIVRFTRQLSQTLPLTEDQLFVSKHMRLHGRTDDPQAGPSLQETLNGLEEAMAQFQKILQLPVEETIRSSLERDACRLDFGVRITRFLYLFCLCSINPNDTVSLQQLQQVATDLESDTDCMKGYDFGDTFRNGLTATWLEKTYYARFAPNLDASQGQDRIAL